MNTDAEAGIRQPPIRSGQVSTAFVQLLVKYGASPQLLRKVGEVTEDHPGSDPSGDIDRATDVNALRRPSRRLGALFARIAGADPDLLELLPSERARYQTLGIAIALSAVTATALFGVALAFIGINVVVAVLLALSWGAMIFFWDRWIAVADLSIERRRPSQPLPRSVPRLLINLARGIFVVAPRVLLTLITGILIATPIVLLVFRRAIDTQIAADPNLRRLPPGILVRLDALEQLAAAHPAIQLSRWLLYLLIILLDAAPVLAALFMHLRPGAYEIAASVQERYFPAKQELSLLRRRALHRGEGPEPESDPGRKLAEMVARIEELTAEIDRTEEQTNAKIIDLATRRRAG